MAQHVVTENQAADIMTKSLGMEKFGGFQMMLEVKE